MLLVQLCHRKLPLLRIESPLKGSWLHPNSASELHM
jgi:hypothetical protein